MKQNRGYRLVPFSFNRRMAAASAAVCSEKTSIHFITEVDVDTPRRLIREHRERTGERLSFTAYIVACLARAIAEHPSLNSIRRGGKLVLLDDVTVGALVERTVDGEKVPEPFGIIAAQRKSFREIHDEIRAAQNQEDDRLGSLSGMSWVRFIPSFLFRVLIRAASHSIHMARRYGVVTVTAVGMFGKGPMWLIPLSGSTVAVSVGGIVERLVTRDGLQEPREQLCLTVSLDHAIIDGAPGARFMKTFAGILESGSLIGEDS